VEPYEWVPSGATKGADVFADSGAGDDRLACRRRHDSQHVQLGALIERRTGDAVEIEAESLGAGCVALRRAVSAVKRSIELPTWRPFSLPGPMEPCFVSGCRLIEIVRQ
jgi:hypothetical protein